MSSSKLILVIGATGAQGMAVIDFLLKASDDGAASPYKVRALTRDPESKRAQELIAKGVECVKGSFEDFTSVKAALNGAHGAWVNTDGFTVGEARETYAGMRIFELAKQTPSMRHYIWSSLDYATKKGLYNPKYNVEHLNGKARVADWMKAQPTIVSDVDMSWSAVSTGPYLDTVGGSFWGPLTRRADGTMVFATPLGEGAWPMISVTDIGFWARYSFDHRTETSGKDLELASEMVTLERLMATFAKVTGLPVVHKKLSFEEFWSYFMHSDRPLAHDNGCSEATTIAQNFTAFLSFYGDGLVKRDMKWLNSINPGHDTLEGFIRGQKRSALKLQEDGHMSLKLDEEKIKTL